jgi:hypothetical protein
MRACRRDEMEAIALALEQLALEIREAAEGGNGSDDECHEPLRSSPRRMARERRAPGSGSPRGMVGKRVRVTIADRYRGRVGTIRGKHGSQYWDICLDPLDGGVTQVIYKKPTSFVVIDDK